MQAFIYIGLGFAAIAICAALLIFFFSSFTVPSDEGRKEKKKDR